MPEPVHTSDQTLERLCNEIADGWSRGARPDAAQALKDHPELAESKSLVLRLVYDEMCLRAEAGDGASLSAFCNRFPSYKSSVARLIEVHKIFEDISIDGRTGLPIRWPAVGEFCCGFKLLDELGRGALGRVFLAQDRGDLSDRHVVLKLSAHGSHEASKLSRLEHPHIVPIHLADYDSESGLYYLVMPYLGRSTLHDLLDRLYALGGLPDMFAECFADLNLEGDEGHVLSGPETPTGVFGVCDGTYIDGVLNLLRRVADALAHTHDRGILHLDLKPSNILINRHGDPMVLDFNLSIDRDVGAATIGATFPYAAPEQLIEIIDEDASVHRPDVATDIFSLGVIAYELLTGHHPFRSRPQHGHPDTLAKRLLKRQRNGPKPLTRWNKQLDSTTSGLIERSLAFEPSERPSSAAELASALAEAQSQRARMKRWLKSRRKSLTAIGSVVLGTSFAGAVYAATLPPKEVRLWQRGSNEYERNRFNAAADCFSELIEMAPDRAAYWFARGSTRIKQERFQDALEDFNQANEIRPSAETEASLGYCETQLGRSRHAIGRYQRALVLGLETKELYNALGYCQMKERAFADAEQSFTEAIRFDDRYLLAIYNRATNELLWSIARKRPTSLQATNDVKRVLAIGPLTPEFLVEAARIQARREIDAASFSDEVIFYLAQAVDLGLSKKALNSHPWRADIRNDPRFQSFSSRIKSGHPMERLKRSTDPLGNRPLQDKSVN